MSSIAQLLDIMMVAAVCAALLAGFPVAFTLGGVALLFAFAGHFAGASISLGAIPSRLFGIMTNETLIAVPLFVFMGVMLERSKVADDLLETMGRRFAGLPGGLGIAVLVVGTLLAASTGIVGATVTTMGVLSLPVMLNSGYSPRLASGTICAAGTLGQIIPPSIVLVVLADQLSGAYQRAQLSAGVFSPETVSVGDLFAGALLPGLALVGLYIVYVLVFAALRPQSAPPLPSGPNADLSWRRTLQTLRALVAPLALVVAVLGSILAGIATPTEAAAVGAVGAVLLAALRQDRGRPWPALAAAAATVLVLLLAWTMDLRVARDAVSWSQAAAIGVAALLCATAAAGLAISARRLHRGGLLRPVVHGSARLTAMIFAILIGASLFTLVFRDLGGEELVQQALGRLPGGALGAVAVVMVAMFVLGFFLDFVEIVFLVVPLVAPVLLSMEMPDGSPMSPVWLGVLMAVNLQTSFLTPPFGFALFYLRGVAPAELGTADIYRGVVPFVALQLLMLVVLWLWPALATWLPAALYR